MDYDPKNDITQLWQRIIDAENKISFLEKKEQDIKPLTDLLARVTTLEDARKKQIEINTRLLAKSQSPVPTSKPLWKLW